jgi:hypothetical protein|tara:strand:+ start:3428 stop:4042 length:615 start_codon:yes stop_codon:yes gene_type:complete
MNEELTNKLKELQNEDKELIKIGKNLVEKIGHTEFTLFCFTVLNRTINLNRGYITLVEDSNYIAAAPLVRLNLDSLLRIFASIQSEFNVEVFANKVRHGAKIRDILYHKNIKQKLTDTKLVNLLKEIKGFKWVDKIYDVGCGYVHLSNQHFYSSVRVKESENVEAIIRKTDEFVTDEEKIAGTFYMIQSSRGIRIFIGDILENL